MKSLRIGLCVLLAAATTAIAFGQSDAAKTFDQLKTLKGNWEGKASNGKDLKVTFRPTSGGTALMSEILGDEDMITMFHMDNNRVLATHYCGAGNQPRMQAKRFDPAIGEIEFQFLDGTNLTPGAGHMHNARFRLVDDKHFQSEWQFYENGKLKFSENPQYTRVR